MPIDPSYIELNHASTNRIRTLAARLTDAQMLTPVGEHWTVAIVFAHLAFWDQRVIYVLDKTEQDGKLFIPDIGVVANDISLPLWAAIPARQAARIALETADALDQRLENFSPQLLNEVYTYNPRWVVRALHRNDHLDEAEAALDTLAAGEA